MAATAIQIQARIDALEESRSSGILTVEYEGRRVTYKSDADMAAALAALKSQLGIISVATGGSPTVRRILMFQVDKGL